MPYAVAASAVPIIAFAPITNAWFGLLNPLSKMAIAAVLCFFPVMVNTLRGLTSVNPRAIELMRSYAAGNVEIFRPRADPDVAAVHVHGPQGRDRALDDRRDRRRVLRRLDERARRAASRTTRAVRLPARLGGDRVASAFGIAFYAAVAFVERLTTSGIPHDAAFAASDGGPECQPRGRRGRTKRGGRIEEAVGHGGGRARVYGVRDVGRRRGGRARRRRRRRRSRCSSSG